MTNGRHEPQNIPGADPLTYQGNPVVFAIVAAGGGRLTFVYNNTVHPIQFLSQLSAWLEPFRHMLYKLADQGEKLVQPATLVVQ